MIGKQIGRVRYDFLLIVVLFFVAWSSYGFILSFRTPVVYFAASAKPDRIPVGGVLNLVYRFNRIRYCQIDLDRFIEKLPDHEIVWRDRVVGGATATGEHTVINPVKLPPEIGPGQYVFRSISNNQCSEWQYAILAPDVSFTIEPAPH